MLETTKEVDYGKNRKAREREFFRYFKKIESAVMSGSVSASYEDGSNYSHDGFNVAVRVYERYSYTGRNRVSLTLTLAGRDGDYFLSAITSGGSQAVFFKFNRWGENAFLDTIRDVIDEL